jgi:hypothetical protein
LHGSARIKIREYPCDPWPVFFVFLRVFSWQTQLSRSGNSFPFFPPSWLKFS